MLKNQEISEVWASWLALLLFAFLVLGTALATVGEEFRQNHVLPPQCGHTISNSVPFPHTTPDHLCGPAPGVVFDEDQKMAEVTIYVSTKEELYEALKNATGGETILLTGGDYGSLAFETNQTFGVPAVFDSTVTIKSSNPDDPATVSSLTLKGADNLAFESISFKSTYSGADIWSSAFTIQNSSNITIRNSLFEGSVASNTGDPTIDGYATGKGLVVNNSTGITIDHNEFSTWHRAMTFGGVTDLVISGNDIHSIRSDGLNFVEVQNVLIEDNYIHDFAGSLSSNDHSDMIQFWTTNSSRPSTDIVIRSNTLDIGDGTPTQSIFMRNEMVDLGQAGLEMYYRNILIEENVILNSHAHGITVGETDYLIIRNNTVLDSDSKNSSSVATPKISIAPGSTNVAVEANVSAAISGFSSQETWSLLNNVSVQNSDPNARGYYELEFLNSSMSGPASQFVVDPSGEIAQYMAGATRLLLDISPNQIRPLFDISSDIDDKTVVVFDGSYSFGPLGQVEEDHATFKWDFGDGAFSYGRVATHVYEKPGYYRAQLTVTTNEGFVSTASSLVGIGGKDVLSYNDQTGLFQSEAFGLANIIIGSGTNSVSSGSAQSLDIGISTGPTTIASKYLGRFFGSDAFDISMILRSDVVGSIGEVFRSHVNMKLSVVSGGDLEFVFWSSMEQVSLRTSGVRVNDGFDHAIQLSFDDSTDSLLVYVDGQLRGSASVEGNVRGDYPRNLDFGADWGKGVFDGKILAFDLDVPRSDYPDYTGSIDFLGLANLVDDGFSSSESNFSDTSTVQENTQSESDQFDPQTDQSAQTSSTESSAFVLDLGRLEEGQDGKLVGDASLIQFEGRVALQFDGKNDAARLGEIEEIYGSSSISISIEFARADLNSDAQTLIKGPSSFKVSLQGDSVILELDGPSGSSNSIAFTAEDLGILDTRLHQLTLKLDDTSDQLQLLIDDSLAFYSEDAQFSLASSITNQWWNSGWTLGSGGRRNNDFDGVITEFQVDDSAMFLSF